MAKLIRTWKVRHWIVLAGGESEKILAVSLDLDGSRRWRPEIRQRFGITLRRWDGKIKFGTCGYRADDRLPSETSR